MNEPICREDSSVSATWPKALKPAVGPMREDKVDGAALGMGDWGAELQALIAEQIVPPDMMTGLTLFILGQQPRNPQKKQVIPGAGGGVAGGVWVRERFTILRPLPRAERFTVEGFAVGRHVHKGRRYGTNRCVTYDEQGRGVAENLTTGLLSYKVQEGLGDTLEGQSPDAVQAPEPNWESAQANPHLDALRELQTGQKFGGYAVSMSLALMEARDTKKPDNPIHSDPELAKKAGLSRPIAGGAHVLAFPLEVVMAQVGRYVLLHGANFDVRWKAPVYADTVMYPHAEVAQVAADRVVFDIGVTLEDDAVAMVGVVTVPLV